MISSHCTEKAIQQFALGEEIHDDAIIAHIASCDHCKTLVANYQQLFLSIEQQPNVLFDFDVTSVVLVQLPVPEEIAASQKSMYGVTMSFIGLVLIGALLYFFRNFFINVASAVSNFLLLAIICAAIIVILYKLADMYNKHQKQLHSLDLN